MVFDCEAQPIYSVSAIPEMDKNYYNSRLVGMEPLSGSRLKMTSEQVPFKAQWLAGLIDEGNYLNMELRRSPCPIRGDKCLSQVEMANMKYDPISSVIEIDRGDYSDYVKINDMKFINSLKAIRNKEVIRYAVNDEQADLINPLFTSFILFDSNYLSRFNYSDRSSFIRLPSKPNKSLKNNSFETKVYPLPGMSGDFNTIASSNYDDKFEYKVVGDGYVRFNFKSAYLDIDVIYDTRTNYLLISKNGKEYLRPNPHVSSRYYNPKDIVSTHAYLLENNEISNLFNKLVKHETFNNRDYEQINKLAGELTWPDDIKYIKDRLEYSTDSNELKTLWNLTVLVNWLSEKTPKYTFDITSGLYRLYKDKLISVYITDTNNIGMGTNIWNKFDPLMSAADNMRNKTDVIQEEVKYMRTKKKVKGTGKFKKYSPTMELHLVLMNKLEDIAKLPEVCKGIDAFLEIDSQCSYKVIRYTKDDDKTLKSSTRSPDIIRLDEEYNKDSILLTFKWPTDSDGDPVIHLDATTRPLRILGNWLKGEPYWGSVNARIDEGWVRYEFKKPIKR